MIKAMTVFVGAVFAVSAIAVSVDSDSRSGNPPAAAPVAAVAHVATGTTGATTANASARQAAAATPSDPSTGSTSGDTPWG